VLCLISAYEGTDLIFRRTVLCVRLEINNCTICQADFPVRLADPRPGEPTDDA
jgi:hypothetical protein